MDAPKRICHQEWNEVTCVMCTFNNLFQKKVFKKPQDLVENHKYLSIQHHLPIEVDISNKGGLIQDVLFVYFKTHGYKIIQVSNKKKNIGWGWAIFELSLKGQKFLHVVAIVHNYTIDSIRFDSNLGVYPWNGHLFGFDFEKLHSVYQIKIHD